MFNFIFLSVILLLVNTGRSILLCRMSKTHNFWKNPQNTNKWTVTGWNIAVPLELDPKWEKQLLQVLVQNKETVVIVSEASTKLLNEHNYDMMVVISNAEYLISSSPTALTCSCNLQKYKALEGASFTSETSNKHKRKVPPPPKTKMINKQQNKNKSKSQKQNPDPTNPKKVAPFLQPDGLVCYTNVIIKCWNQNDKNNNLLKLIFIIYSTYLFSTLQFSFFSF